MQNATVQGGSVATAGEDLSAFGLGAGNGGDFRLVKIANSSSDPVILLPTNNSDVCPYILTGGDIAGNDVALDINEPSANRRVKLKGTCNPGDTLVLADVGTAADKGKLRVLPSTPGTYMAHGIAEESGVDGQNVLYRPCIRPVTVSA